MNKKFIKLIFLFIYSTSWIFANAVMKDTSYIQNPSNKRIYNATRLYNEKPEIDGKLNDECWRKGVWGGNFVQWIPKEGALPSQPTWFKILYDNYNIYVAIRSFDSVPKKISRKGGRRDEIIGDAVGVSFDSYHDLRTGFEFSVTSAGQKIDDILTNPQNLDMNWNPVWKVKTGIEDSAWVAEYAIPLSQLRYSPAKEQVWGLHVWRWIDRHSEESDWDPQSSTSPGMLYLFGELHGIKDLEKSKRIEIMPYSTGKLRTFFKDPVNPFLAKGYEFSGNIGLDAKIGLSSNFTVDLSVNPDFGQVESDPSVMNLTAFETFYEEKRPFFLEGKNIFKFDIGEASLFYSRRIGHAPIYQPQLNYNQFVDYHGNTSILSAEKFSGKTSKGLSVGVLHSITNGEKARISTNGQIQNLRVEPFTGYTVGRVQQDFNAGTTTLGAILTATNRLISDSYLEFQNRNAYTYGVDFLHQWNDKEFFMDVKLIGSMIYGTPEAIQNLQLASARYYQRPDATYLTYDPNRTNLAGHGGALKIGKGSKGLWRFNTAVNWRSPGLDLNDLGYLQMADLVEQKNEFSYFTNKPVSVFRTYSVSLNQNNTWDYGLNYMYSDFMFSGSFEFLNHWGISPYVHYRNEGLDKYLLRGGEAFLLPSLWEGALNLHSDNAKKVIVNISANHTLAKEDNYNSSMVDAKLTFIPYNVLKFSVSANYSENTNNLQYIETKTFNGIKKHLLGKLNQNTFSTTFRVDYNISPELSIQYYGSPFLSTGKYSDFKEVVNPKAKAYTDRFLSLNTTYLNNSYQVESKGNIPAYTITNPDFTFSQFRSNFVFSWEYKPGSQLFFIYGVDRTAWNNDSNLKFWDALTKYNKPLSNDVFLIKLRYWFSV